MAHDRHIFAINILPAARMTVNVLNELPKTHVLPVTGKVQTMNVDYFDILRTEIVAGSSVAESDCSNYVVLSRNNDCNSVQNLTTGVDAICGSDRTAPTFGPGWFNLSIGAHQYARLPYIDSSLSLSSIELGLLGYLPAQCLYYPEMPINPALELEG
nr:hypothetical protein CFP56_24655 [Quercus suber]